MGRREAGTERGANGDERRAGPIPIPPGVAGLI